MDKDKRQKESSMDQAKRFDQQQAEEKHRRQAGKDRQGSQQQGGFGQHGQQQAENRGGRQQGGFSDEDMRRQGRKPASERDRDYNPDGDRNER
ncbi:hypothetical protein [Mesorhizobium sp. 1B3]|uniref:hypothetical protein n=1 Tax=Mesorhizobium sp. 1B3 TaxID=3243599 RepID=UPI003D96FB78